VEPFPNKWQAWMPSADQESLSQEARVFGAGVALPAISNLTWHKNRLSIHWAANESGDGGSEPASRIRLRWGTHVCGTERSLDVQPNMRAADGGNDREARKKGGATGG
jgi:hypothetical protein